MPVLEREARDYVGPEDRLDSHTEERLNHEDHSERDGSREESATQPERELYDHELSSSSSIRSLIRPVTTMSPAVAPPRAIPMPIPGAD